ncbi:ABC transporter ATP-binding protein [Halorhabdus sp. BNX81]|uniref:ABC transporter ATP-binding protein n=1 Tax=Halorhabdus sp. BNX81 TaxID=2980181 RepID=UPI0023DD0A04|nr:ABC transporter ATP-binding protein [Halorhabdus sp. BNX81]WEL21765.1 ABC-type multidrug transport system, ATPase component [Halorhabdus sp. BNX81]
MILKTEQLGKRWGGDVWGIQDVSLELDSGVVGLLGPNGAGKSTLMQLISTVTKPTEGRITWNGTDIVDSPGTVRSVLGYLPQDFGVYPNLTATEFLEYMAALKGLPGGITDERIDELLTIANLTDYRDRKLETFSGGMRQRVGIAQALMNDPDLLIVDEPTVGLDPAERVRFRNVIADLTEDRIVVLSTHIVSDVESTATELVILDGGTVAAQTTPEGLMEDVDGTTWEWMVSSDRLSAVKATYPVTKTVRKSGGILIRAVSEDRPSSDASLVEPTLEDAYLWTIDNDGERQ